MKIAFFESKAWEKRYLGKRLQGHEVDFHAEPLRGENVDRVRGFDAISVFIYSRIDRQILGRMPGLRIIVTRSTGFDHIDIKECRRRKIAVCNVPFYGENTVAEHVFALILSLSRKIYDLQGLSTDPEA